MGTANVLEALRVTRCAGCCVVITSDKCYAAPLGSYAWAHSETDPLGGDDPYSASKAAAEIVSHSYWQSFGGTQLTAVATARAGNILGGGIGRRAGSCLTGPALLATAGPSPSVIQTLFGRGNTSSTLLQATCCWQAPYWPAPPLNAGPGTSGPDDARPHRATIGRHVAK